MSSLTHKQKKPLIKTSIEEQLANYNPSARKIIVTAQTLFAERGIDDVSLREIATKAGQANNSAVQYHFESKEGLIQAIFELRIPFLEAARKRRLEELKARGNITLKDLLEVHLFPILEMFDEQEQRIFTLFSSHLLSRPTLDHPFYRAQAKMPVGTEIYHRLESSLPHLPKDIFDFRIRLIAGFFLSSILERQKCTSSKKHLYKDDSIFWGDMINVLAAMLAEPFTGEKRPLSAP